MPKYEVSPPLKQFPIKDFTLGYNSYANSKTLIKDREIPYGKNVVLDDNGSMTKRNGSQRYGGEVTSGKSVKNGAQFRTPSVNQLIVAVGTLWKKKNGDNWDTISGATFTNDLEWDFCQTVGTSYGSRLYGANGTDALAYYDGTNLTSVSSNGNIGSQVVAFNGRLYMNNTTYPDRIYYSNPYSYAPATAAFDISNFGTFNTDLGSTPKKNAGYLMLDPGSGTIIKKLKVYSSAGSSIDKLYVLTDRGLWEIIPVGTPLTDGSIAHSIRVVVDGKGTPAPKSVIQMGNDIKFYDYDNIYSLGEQAQYQNIRVSTLSGRIKSEINEVSSSGRKNVALGFFKDRLWFSYQRGSYNDRMELYDVRLNAWSAPLQGLNIGWFLEFIENDGTHRWIGGSSNPADSYVYELDLGLNDVTTAVSAEFDTKSTDCGYQGLIKRYAFINVFYALLYGVLSYEVFLDEVSSITGKIALGSSASAPSGIGTQLTGTFLVGREYNPNTTFSSLKQNDMFKIELAYKKGKRISVRFSNNNKDEQFKINGLSIWYLPGDIQEG